MRIAVTCTNLKKHLLKGHAGRTATFLVYEVKEGVLLEVDPIRLTREQIPHNYFHNLGGVGPHPLFDSIDVLLVGSGGRHFIERTAKMGIKTIITDETDPDIAVLAFIKGKLRDITEKACNHHDHDHHHHDHDHDHHH